MKLLIYLLCSDDICDKILVKVLSLETSTTCCSWIKCYSASTVELFQMNSLQKLLPITDSARGLIWETFHTVCTCLHVSHQT